MSERRLVDLSHAVSDGMVTYPGLPAPVIGTFLSREESRRSYAEGTEFFIGSIEMAANTGTYLDTPFHRFADGYDLAALDLERVVEVPGVLVDLTAPNSREITSATLEEAEVTDRAVLLHTGWSVHWGTGQYFVDHPHLGEEAAALLAQRRPRLVGIDSLNIDSTSGGHRPAHTKLLEAGIPIVEHLTGLDRLPPTGFRFTAVPAPVAGLASFPVRAYASIP